MKKKFIIIGVIVILLLGILLVFFNRSDNDSIKFKNEYESLNGTKNDSGKKIRSINIPKDNPFIYADAKDIVKKINNKETFLVYFGFAKCPWCRSVLPNLIKALEENDIDTIYYVDILDIRDVKEVSDDGSIKITRDGTDDYYKLLTLLDEVLSDYILTSDDKKINTGEKRIYAPNVVAIVDGKATKLVEGISDKQTDAYMELTDEMNDDSYKDFMCVINCILDSKKICTNDKKC